MTKDADKLRQKALEIRNAAASQLDDLKSGNYPKKLGKEYFRRHIAKLEAEAEALDAEADKLNTQ